MTADRIANLPQDLKFVSDSQCVDAIHALLDIDDDYGSFLVRSRPSFEFAEFAGYSASMVLECIKDRQFIELWGIEGIVPWNHKMAYKVSIVP